MKTQNFKAADAERGREDQGLSLEDLAASFAARVGAGEDPYAPAPSADPMLMDAVGFTVPTVPGPDITPRSIVEAMLFVGDPAGEPLTSQKMAEFMRGVNPSEVDQLVVDLNEQYHRNACPYTIESHGAGYRLALTAEYGNVREKLSGRVREARLSQGAIEILALVAYNGSMTGDEISRLRGRPSGAMLAQLVRRQLLQIERSVEKPRVARYSTTARFLSLFGLESLSDLPRSQEVDER